VEFQLAKEITVFIQNDSLTEICSIQFKQRNIEEIDSFNSEKKHRFNHTYFNINFCFVFFFYFFLQHPSNHSDLLSFKCSQNHEEEEEEDLYRKVQTTVPVGTFYLYGLILLNM